MTNVNRKDAGKWYPDAIKALSGPEGIGYSSDECRFAINGEDELVAFTPGNRLYWWIWTGSRWVT